MKYLFSIAAIHSSGKGMKLDHVPIYVEVNSVKKANEAALEVARKRWPVTSGWAGHSAVSLLRRMM